MVKKILYTVIPFFICFIISLVNYNREIKLDNLYNVSGVVAEYIPPRGGVRTVNTPMAVVIGDTKYKVSDGVRWASNIKVLEEALKEGNEVSLKYYKTLNNSYVIVSIKSNDEDIVTVDECIFGLTNQKEAVSFLIFYVGVSWAFAFVLIYILASKKYNLSFDFKYPLKIYYSNFLKIFFIVLLSVSYFAIVVVSVSINKYLYIPLIVFLSILIYLLLTSLSSIKAGKPGIIVFHHFKRYAFNWNNLREYLVVEAGKHYKIVLNFDEKYEKMTEDVNCYLSLCKEKNNKNVFNFKVNKEQLRLLKVFGKKHFK